MTTAAELMTLSRNTRRLNRRIYTGPLLMTDGTPVGTNSASAIVDGGSGPPQIKLVAGDQGGAVNQMCSNYEHFNQDVFSWGCATADLMWALPNVVRAFGSLSGQNLPVAGAYWGAAFGDAVAVQGASYGSQAALQLRYNMTTGHWEAVVINKYGASGHKVFEVDLGARPQNVNAFILGRDFLLEIEFTPSPIAALASVAFFINKAPVLTFTDAANGNGDTPLADLYAHRETVGLTLKGGGMFCSTGNNGGSDTTALFKVLVCETHEVDGPTP